MSLCINHCPFLQNLKQNNVGRKITNKNVINGIQLTNRFNKQMYGIKLQKVIVFANFNYLVRKKGKKIKSFFKLFSHPKNSLRDSLSLAGPIVYCTKPMIQVMRELSTELNFLGEESAKSVPKPVGKLTNINLLITIQLDNVHFMLNLVIYEFEDTLVRMNFLNERCRKLNCLHEYSRPRIETALKIAFIVESDNIFIWVLKFLINAISVIKTLSELTCVFWSDSPSVKTVILELSFVDKFSLFVQFTKSVKLWISQLTFKN